MRVEPASLDQLLHPRFDPKSKLPTLTRGLAASPGAAVGQAVFDADVAAELGHAKQRVILVRKETTPDDIHGMDAAQGILTATGGMTSHAAVVARGMGKPCVSGAADIRVDEVLRRMHVGDRVVREGDWISPVSAPSCGRGWIESPDRSTSICQPRRSGRSTTSP